MLLQPGALALSDMKNYNICVVLFVIHTKASLFGKDDGKSRRLFCYKNITNHEKGLYIILARCNIQP